MGYQMRTVEEVRKDILDAVKPLDPVTLPLMDAWGCVLAEDVVAQYDIPTFASSAMDGYAVRSADLSDRRGDAAPGGERVHRQDSGCRGWPGRGDVDRHGGARCPREPTASLPRRTSPPSPRRSPSTRRSTAGSFVRPPGQDLKEGDIVVPGRQDPRRSGAGQPLDRRLRHASRSIRRCGCVWSRPATSWLSRAPSPPTARSPTATATRSRATCGSWASIRSGPRSCPTTRTCFGRCSYPRLPTSTSSSPRSGCR